MASKTYKREVALAILGGLGYVIYTGDHQMVEVLVWPAFTFAALSFGLDWWGKAGSIHRPYEPSRMQHNGSTQPTDGWRSQRSSQYADREDQPTGG